MAVGMILKLQRDPRTFIREAYQRCEKELGLVRPVDASPLSIEEVAPLNSLVGAVPRDRMTEPTLYIPIIVGGSPQFALLDSGAELTVASTAFANFAQLVHPGYANVCDASFAISGVNGVRSAMQVLQTSLVVGGKSLKARTHEV